MTEDALQKMVVRFLKTTVPDLVFYHPANGGFRNVREAAKLKAMGVKAGVADLAVVLPDLRAAFIELKTSTGRVNANQAEFQSTCDRLGIPYAVCRSVDDVAATLKGWGVNLRARSPE